MYCPRCGKEIKNNDLFCPYCGARFNNGYHTMPQNAGVMPDDSPSLLFVFIGFFFPLIGLILFIIYDSKSPKKAKSAGKGAIISVIVRTIIVVIYFVFVVGIFGFSFNAIKEFGNEMTNDIHSEQIEENSVLNDVEVTFGDFVVTSKDFYNETSLEVKIKNISDSRSTFIVTIEAVDEDGVRIGTSTVYADQLNSDQEVYEEAFSYVEEDKLEQYKNAVFKVLDVQKFSF